MREARFSRAVVPGLVPGTHAAGADGRDKPGHDAISLHTLRAHRERRERP